MPDPTSPSGPPGAPTPPVSGPDVRTVDVMRRALADGGEPTLAAAGALDAWSAATAFLLRSLGSAAPTDALGCLATAARWATQAEALARLPRTAWRDYLLGAEGVRRLGPESLERLIADVGTAADAAARVGARELRLARLLRASDAELRDALAGDTEHAIAILEALRDEPPSAFGARVRAAFPELTALAVSADPAAAIEHEPAEGGRPRPLLDHLSRRVLGRKLLGLERGDRGLFQRDEALSAPAFAAECATLRRVRDAGLLAAVRTALCYLDVAKGGDDATRATWTALGADLTVHNTAARTILERGATPGRDTPGVLRGFSFARAMPALERLTLALVDAHGLTGQAVRGETPLALFAPFLDQLSRDVEALAAALGTDAGRARDLVIDCLHVVNVCDTAGVREGLLTDALRDHLVAVEAQLRAVAAAPNGGAHAGLAAVEEAAWRQAEPDPDRRPRARLVDRLARLRAGRIRAGEPRASTEAVVDALDDATVAALLALLARCQFWYAEAGTALLSPEAQLKVLVLGMARAACAVPRGQPFHVSLLPLIPTLGTPRDRSVPYRVRLVEAILAPVSVADILAGGADARALLTDAGTGDSAPAQGGGEPGRAAPLGSFGAAIGGTAAVLLAFEESEEARALLTLLPAYERKSSAAFHATLKALCDLYGLRKDEFDRVANEELYLVHMNGARADKARMLDYVRAGRVVEVGPGGGVVLDLLEARWPGSEIIGIDASATVVEALRQRRAAQGRRWDIRHADAFELPALVGTGTVDSVIFCSVLHEIYSYVEYPADGSGQRSRFRLEAVRDLLRASYRALSPGGRIIIRDGVMPGPGTRILEFLSADAEEFFHLFVKQFEGRPVRFEPAGTRRVRLSAADAMEFLYTYVWGPESFPYEVREQYGVLPYVEYRDRMVEWLSESGPPPRVVPLAAGEDHYLQDGYRRGLAGSVRLLDADGLPTELPDSNALWVLEKPDA